MSSNEWELLAIAEDIEPGDTVKVELEDGSTALMIFTGIVRSTVRLVDEDGNVRRYSASSLEELDEGGTYITGKSEQQLRISSR